MRGQSMRTMAGPALALLVVAGSATLLADDAKKRDLKLAKCAATYKVDLTACESQAQAGACYQRADATDLACRRAEGAVGNSDVETSFIEKRRAAIHRITVKLPLNCGTGLNTTCADGHARLPVCERSGSLAIVDGQAIRGGSGEFISLDADGDKDRCSGQTIRCPAGFTLSPRPGQDLCWDSVANRDKYAY